VQEKNKGFHFKDKKFIIFIVFIEWNICMIILKLKNENIKFFRVNLSTLSFFRLDIDPNSNF
jgi:hypothetical protein